MHVEPREPLPKIMMARYYSAGFARFASADPSTNGVILHLPQSWNAYTYALNNPVRLYDPDGLSAADSVNVGLDHSLAALREIGLAQIERGTTEQISVYTGLKYKRASVWGVVGTLMEGADAFDSYGTVALIDILHRDFADLAVQFAESNENALSALFADAATEMEAIHDLYRADESEGKEALRALIETIAPILRDLKEKKEKDKNEGKSGSGKKDKAGESDKNKSTPGEDWTTAPPPLWMN